MNAFDYREVLVFENADFGIVRTINIDGEPYFVGKDVAEILGYVNPAKAIREHVDAEDKGVNEMDTPGGKQDIIFINESGLYSLVLRSQLPTARKFKRWVTTEVLPAIRRHGVYAIEDLINNPDALIAALTALKDEREKRKSLELTVATQTQQIAELEPKAGYYDNILASQSTMPTTQIAKDYGMSAQRFNTLLHRLGIQYKLNNAWFLYQSYAAFGYTQSFTHCLPDGKAVAHTRWTQKGRLFLYERLREIGILPISEKE